VLFFGNDHGGEAVLGRRDAYWASGGSAVTNSLLLSAVWVVGAVFADQNAPALDGILNQQGAGNSMRCQYTRSQSTYSISNNQIKQGSLSPGLCSSEI
jgi:hypothetical protein